MNGSEAISELQRIGRAFASLASLESVLEVVSVAESKTLAAQTKLTEIEAKIADVQAKHDADEVAFAKHYAALQKNAADAEEIAKNELSKLKADGADALKKAKDKLADLKESIEAATKAYTDKIAEEEKRLIEKESAIALAQKKLDDINAAIAAIAGR